MTLDLIFIGPPGAGKGTQVSRISSERCIPSISSGDMLREVARCGTLLGNQVREVMSRGDLLSDDLMVAVIRERLRRHDVMGGVVLDGFPRTVGQAVALDSILVERALVIIVLSVAESELVRRLSQRRICRTCGINAVDGSNRCAQCGDATMRRPDDNVAAIKRRLEIYQRETLPVLEYYRPHPGFRVIDGAQSPERVAADIFEAIEQVHSSSESFVRRLRT